MEPLWREPIRSEQFRTGVDVEFEHRAHDPERDVTGDDPILAGKIALTHVKEFPELRAPRADGTRSRA
jgi:hypothetical protein